MEKIESSSTHRNRMARTCVELFALLAKKRRVSLCTICGTLNLSDDTARRWIKAFGLIMNVQIRRGIVIVGDGPPGCDDLHVK